MYRTKGLGVAYQDTVSLSSSLFPSRSLFSLSSPLFRCRLRHKPRTVLRLLYFPYLSRPPHHALCTASTSCVKLCAIPLTFDNRCSSAGGNYIPLSSPRIRFSTSCLLSPFKLAHSCAFIFLLSTDLQM